MRRVLTVRSIDPGSGRFSHISGIYSSDDKIQCNRHAGGTTFVRETLCMFSAYLCVLHPGGGAPVSNFLARGYIRPKCGTKRNAPRSLTSRQVTHPPSPAIRHVHEGWPRVRTFSPNPHDRRGSRRVKSFIRTHSRSDFGFRPCERAHQRAYPLP